jgi:hypothetical protein
MSFLSERHAKNIAKGKDKLVEEAIGMIGDTTFCLDAILDVLGNAPSYQKEAVRQYRKKLRDLEDEFVRAMAEAAAEDFAESLEHPNLLSALGCSKVSNFEGVTCTVQVTRKSDGVDKVFPIEDCYRAAIAAWLEEA